jgi:heme/copper-type cytochrome/quinol oxidase subunit 4
MAHSDSVHNNLERSFGKGLKPYRKYYLPFLFSMISGFGFFLLTTTSMSPEFQCTVVFLLNIILIFLPIFSFQYGRITKQEKIWFILYQTLITGFPYTILLWNGTKAFLYHNLIFFGWIALWGLLGRIKRKNKA